MFSSLRIRWRRSFAAAARICSTATQDGGASWRRKKSWRRPTAIARECANGTPSGGAPCSKNCSRFAPTAIGCAPICVAPPCLKDWRAPPRSRDVSGLERFVDEFVGVERRRVGRRNDAEIVHRVDAGLPQRGYVAHHILPPLGQPQAFD